jgi:uncharacterized protein (DUF169 family)
VFAIGETEIEFVVAPLSQLKLVAPLAIIVALAPEQIVALFAATVGV